MLYITDDCTDPYRNLAEEEFLLKNFSEPIFRLWRNDNTIVVGLNQNTLAEIDYDYVTEHNIKVVRRMTGGGAVFHDLGNLNFTFIQDKIPGEDTAEMFRRFTYPIIEALNSLGVKAYLKGRNDLLIDERKFSGNAVCTWKNRILQHGTLLFDVSMTDLSAALKARPEKFAGKAVQSNRMRVTNIKEHLLPIVADEKEKAKYPALAGVTADNLNVLWFRDFLGDYICTHGGAGNEANAVKYDFTAEENKAIDELRDKKYGTREWNFGSSPKFASRCVRKLAGGILEFYFTVDKGVITELKVHGDYFFSKPTEEFEQLMRGTPHTPEAIEKKISTLDTDAYFSNIQASEIAEMFF